MIEEFGCVQDCSDCCINRQYFPSIEFGKIGVLLLPSEKLDMEEISVQLSVPITILPRIGIGDNQKPRQILAYQLMGLRDGDYCPFLDTESKKRSPNGGFNCTIYDLRPLACKAYPVIKEIRNEVELDCNCKYSCTRFNFSKKNFLQNELIALSKIQKSMKADTNSRIWRYATATGEKKYEKLFLREGWYIQDIT